MLLGNTAYESLTLHSCAGPLASARNVPTRRSSRYCLHSQWRLRRCNEVTFDRYYEVFIYDACNEDRPVFPKPSDPRFGPCDNDDSLHASAMPSLCPVLQSHHVPAGLAPHECDALSVASTALDATLAPDTYDPHFPALLTATTSFDSNIAERLSDGTCLAHLDWRDIAWSMRWPQPGVAAVPVGQRGDGSIPPPDPAQPPLTHADTIRGRLLQLFPRAPVVRPGTETVGGAAVGDARSEVVGWTYLGPPTDAPPREATTPETSAPPDLPVSVQWNHAQRLDSRHRPVDEEVPLRLPVRTTYPDGHSEDQVVPGSIAVSISDVGLMDVG